MDTGHATSATSCSIDKKYGRFMPRAGTILVRAPDGQFIIRCASAVKGEPPYRRIQAAFTIIIRLGLPHFAFIEND